MDRRRAFLVTLAAVATIAAFLTGCAIGAGLSVLFDRMLPPADAAYEDPPQGVEIPAPPEQPRGTYEL